jgi:hypothetical protein
VSLTLNGKGRVFEMNLRADFDACTLSYEPVFRKKTGTNGKLEITATLSPDSLVLTRGRLDLGPAGLTVTGERRMTDKGNQIPAGAQPFRLRGELAETDLAAMNGLLPPLEKFRLSGQLAGHYTLEGTGTAVKQAGGSLTGRNLGVHFSQILQGELQGFNGRATLLRDRMEWSGVTGRLVRTRSPSAASCETGLPPVSNWTSLPRKSAPPTWSFPPQRPFFTTPRAG